MFLGAEGVGHKVTDKQRRAALDWLAKWLGAEAGR
jgi:hypothetical protein